MTQTNRYYENTLQATLGGLVRSAAIKAQLDALQHAFDLLQSSVDSLEGSGGITSLSGFPASFSGAALKYLQVNAAESAIQFVTGGKLGIKSIAGTSYTLTAADAGQLLITSNASPVSITVPASVLSQGDVVCIVQGAAGQVTLVADTGVTLASSDSLLKTRKQDAQIAIVARDGTPTTASATLFGVVGERDPSGLGVAFLAAANLFTKAQTVTPVALTDAATIATDASLSNTFTVTLGGNRTLGNPTNMSNGVILNWRITQDGTGSRTLGYGSKFKWAGGVAPTLTTAAGSVDYIVGQYFSDSDTILCNILKAFA